MQTSEKCPEAGNYDLQAAREYFRSKVQFTTGPVELDYALKEGSDYTVIDVRLPADFAKGHIPGAINLPEESWESLEGLNRVGTNVIYCYSQVCHLAARAAHIFAEKGYQVMELEGGFATWKEFGFKVAHESHVHTKTKNKSPRARSQHAH